MRSVWSTSALTLGVAVIGYYAWEWQSIASLSFTLDPVSASGPCRADDGSTALFCDFAKHYYPQGEAIFTSQSLVPGYFYPLTFAVFMGLLTSVGYEAALAMWVGLLVVSMLTLYGLPQAELLGGSWIGVAHTIIFLTSLPVLHNFIWGQVSALVAVLVMGALVTYAKGHRTLSAMALAAAIVLKIYPAIFLSYFVLKRDTKALAICISSCFALLIAVPVMALGPEAATHLSAELVARQLRYSRNMATSPYANSLSAVFAGQFPGWPAGFWIVVGGLIALVNGVVLYRVMRVHSADEPYWAATLAFTATPFVVSTTWVHSLVYLPLLQSFMLWTLVRSSLSGASKGVLGLMLLLPSVALVSFPLFLAIDDADGYYRSGYPFFANALVLTLAYIMAHDLIRARRLTL